MPFAPMKKGGCKPAKELSFYALHFCTYDKTGGCKPSNCIGQTVRSCLPVVETTEHKTVSCLIFPFLEGQQFALYRIRNQILIFHLHKEISPRHRR